jgi:long-chain fatty acid transport protein
MLSRVQVALALVLAAWGGLVGTSAVEAGGFALPDQGAQAMGLGGASVARATGADSFQSNIAGLAFASRPELVLGGASRFVQTKFTGAEPYPGTLAEERQSWIVPPAPVFGYAQPLGERIVFGLGLSTPFDLRTSWDVPTAFSGRFVAQNASLTSYTASPALGIRLADRLAIGGAVDLNFTRLVVERRLAAINPFSQRRVDGGTLRIQSDTANAIGFRAGLLARPSEAFSIGLAYRQGASFDLTGTGTVTRLPTGVAQLDSYLGTIYPPSPESFSETVALPSVSSAGVAYTWLDWTLAAQVELQRWGSFQSLAVNFPATPDLTTTIARGYKDTYALRFGFERRLNRLWTVRGGYAYETTPASAPESLSPVFVDANRHAVAFGFTVKAGAWRIDVAPGLMLYAKRATQGVSPEGYDGTYENLVPVLGLSIGHVF